DTVWDLMVRSQLILTGHNVHKLHQMATARVNATAQSQAVQRLLPLLTEAEEDIFRRGRNAHARHAAPKHQDPAAYAAATGLEALMGYLYLTGQDDRLDELFSQSFSKEE
ncbi:MAG: ribonuclease III, partial [Clostridia bacterium]|nr:ribonuclease III [Clostridia bacterium]